MNKSMRHLVVETDKPLSQVYPHDVQLYDDFPQGDMFLPTLIPFVQERLAVLKLVEQISLGAKTTSPLECRIAFCEALKEHNYTNFIQLVCSPMTNATEERLLIRRDDHASHFVTACAISFNEGKKRWLVKQESLLFYWRFIGLPKTQLHDFLRTNKLFYAPISEFERMDIMEDLKNCCWYVDDFNTTKFYKAEFHEVLDVMSKLRAFVKHGIAYIPESELPSLVLYHFKKKLNDRFLVAQAILASRIEDPRFVQLMKNISEYNMQSRFSYKETICLEELDELVDSCYPMCMKMIHKHLKKYHHVTNGGRVQYTLFLKGIGLSSADAMKLWKTEFLKKIDERTFQKEYAYHVQHLYGERGREADYQPYDCDKIIGSFASGRDCHGCPFRRLSKDTLKGELESQLLPPNDIEDIVSLSVSRNYKAACTKLFEVTHEQLLVKPLYHPNDYFRMSKHFSLIDDF